MAKRMNNPENTFKTIQLVAQWHWKQIGQCYPDMNGKTSTTTQSL